MAAGIDRAALAARIQGFGNVNPPPLEEETGSTVAKRAIGRLGDLVGEEVMLTVEDFREKGAVGAVKDAVADAGDILIDSVSGILGWIRGDPPPEEESRAAEEATKALSNGPGGAAYGISQASPTGGINAVWVMPEEADPSCLAQLASQQGPGFVEQMSDPRVPKNIQPYQPLPETRNAPPPYQPSGPYSIPGGPTIAPYEPVPSGPGLRAPSISPFVSGACGAGASASAGRWGPAGYSASSIGAASSTAAPASGAKGFVERIVKGEVLVGPDAAKRLVSQCQATNTTGKQLGQIVSERARRMYLGLDGDDDADACLLRLLGLADALAQLPASDFAKAAAEEIKHGTSEEFLSLRSSARHKDEAEAMLRRIGLSGGQAVFVADIAEVDLLGGGSCSSAASPSAPAGATDSRARRSEVVDADLLGGSDAPAVGSGCQADLLCDAEADLLGGDGGVAATHAPASRGVADLDPLAALPSMTPADAVGDGAGLLAGLSMEGAGPLAAVPSAPLTGTAPVMAGTLGSGAKLAEKEDVFGFVGAELTKASRK